MSSTLRPGGWSLRRVQQTLGLSRRVVHGLIAESFVSPVRGPGNQLRFTFQDLVMLRTAVGLQRAQVPPRRILQALARLREELPASLPLTGLRITAEGANVVVRERGVPRDAMTGQLVMDFELVVNEEGSLALLNAPPTLETESSATLAAKAHVVRGEDLEDLDRSAAASSFREALLLDPTLLDAYVRLGTMLCEDGACAEAVAVFEAALQHGLGSALLHFNHAIALEDMGRQQAAMTSYASALALDPEFADAHFNLALLLQAQNDVQGALRHWSAYRRIQRVKG